MTSFDILSLKNDVNVPSKSNKQKKCKKLVFYWHLKLNDENSRIRIRIRIRIRTKMLWIRNTGTFLTVFFPIAASKQHDLVVYV